MRIIRWRGTSVQVYEDESLLRDMYILRFGTLTYNEHFRLGLWAGLPRQTK